MKKPTDDERSESIVQRLRRLADAPHPADELVYLDEYRAALHAAVIEILRLTSETDARAEVKFQDLCHNTKPDDVQRFCDGCENYQIELFGSSPITELRESVQKAAWDGFDRGRAFHRGNIDEEHSIVTDMTSKYGQRPTA